jgi:hypothetical protein
MTASDSAAQTINSQCPTRHHVHSLYVLSHWPSNLGSTTGEQGVHQRITDDSTMARMAVDRMLEWSCRKEPASAGFLLLEINKHPWERGLPAKASTRWAYRTGVGLFAGKARSHKIAWRDRIGWLKQVPLMILLSEKASL